MPSCCRRARCRTCDKAHLPKCSDNCSTRRELRTGFYVTRFEDGDSGSPRHAGAELGGSPHAAAAARTASPEGAPEPYAAHHGYITPIPGAALQPASTAAAAAAAAATAAAARHPSAVAATDPERHPAADAHAAAAPSATALPPPAAVAAATAAAAVDGHPDFHDPPPATISHPANPPADATTAVHAQSAHPPPPAAAAAATSSTALHGHPGPGAAAAPDPPAAASIARTAAPPPATAAVGASAAAAAVDTAAASGMAASAAVLAADGLPGSVTPELAIGTQSQQQPARRRGTQHALAKHVHAANLAAYTEALAALPHGRHAALAQHLSESATNSLSTAWLDALGDRGATSVATSLLRTHLLKTLHLPDPVLTGGHATHAVCRCPQAVKLEPGNAYHHLSSCANHNKTPRSNTFLAGLDNVVAAWPGHKSYRKETRPFVGSQDRPDRELSGVAGMDPGLAYLLDATVVEPCAPRYVAAASKTAGVTARWAHQRKVLAYGAKLGDTQRLVPIAVETHGAVHPSVAELLKEQAKNCAEHAPHSAPSGGEEGERLRRLTSHHVRCFRLLLSVALVKGTAKHVHVAASNSYDAAAPADAVAALGRRLTRSEHERSSMLGRHLWRPPPPPPPPHLRRLRGRGV